MFIFEMLIALVIALILAGVLVYPVRRRGPGPMEGLLFFFLILFLAVWAGGLWVRPIGPMAWETPWLTFLLVGLVIALILAAAAPPRLAKRRPPAEMTDTDVATPLAVTLGLFFYIALIGLGLSILLGYLY